MESELNSQGSAAPSRQPMNTLVSEMRMASITFCPSCSWDQTTSVDEGCEQADGGGMTAEAMAIPLVMALVVLPTASRSP